MALSIFAFWNARSVIAFVVGIVFYQLL